jgi:hypothetical protein
VGTFKGRLSVQGFPIMQTEEGEKPITNMEILLAQAKAAQVEEEWAKFGAQVKKDQEKKKKEQEGPERGILRAQSTTNVRTTSISHENTTKTEPAIIRTPENVFTQTLVEHVDGVDLDKLRQIIKEVIEEFKECAIAAAGQPAVKTKVVNCMQVFSKVPLPFATWTFINKKKNYSTPQQQRMLWLLLVR